MDDDRCDFVFSKYSIFLLQKKTIRLCDSTFGLCFACAESTFALNGNLFCSTNVDEMESFLDHF